ncbi:hypothetical protein ACNJYA_09720 [Bradyrhizobium sp. DASA03068]|uniref:hypothetical protein n=1 Tax=Bradyrhizobium sp. BLXBL-01 TaxID=3395915 RepID=UPI003F730731
MVAPDVIVQRLVDLCIAYRIPLIRIGGKPLTTFFQREDVEKYFVGFARRLASNEIREFDDYEISAHTKAFSDLADEIGFDELERLIKAHLSTRMPEYLSLRAKELRTMVETSPPVPVPEFPPEKLQAIEFGFRELGLLAEAEYHQSIEEVVAGGDKEQVAARIGRLVGVVIKKPFANVEYMTAPSSRTHAYRSWHLKDKSDFDAAAKMNKAQHDFLNTIRDEVKPGFNTYQFAQEAQNESGFFGLYAQACGRYICGDKKIRARVAAALKAAKLGGVSKALTPEAIVGAGGLTLGAYLVEALPIFGMAGAPVIAGLILILYTLGIEAFCKRSGDLRTDELEKH